MVVLPASANLADAFFLGFFGLLEVSRGRLVCRRGFCHGQKHQLATIFEFFDHDGYKLKCGEC